MEEQALVGNYRIVKEIGKGSFGTVYEAVNVNNNQKVALKMEETKSEKSQLQNEFTVYKALQGIRGIPDVYYFGSCQGKYYLTITKLEKSLAEIHLELKKFTLKTVCMIAKRMLRIIEEMHKKEYVYRDLKPENILLYNNDIYLIDYGMCKKYIIDKKHIKLITGKVLTGTARYASVNTHKGLEQSRRDDLEGLGYVLIFLLEGDLPWMGLPAPTRKEKYDKIARKKDETTSEMLCKNLPNSKYFYRYMEYVKKLEFTETPNYGMLIGIFDKIMKKNKIKDDGVFDWVTRPEIVTKKQVGFWKNLKTFFK